ncbi:MAG: hypothetical protein JWR69_2511 [Pedosphaera sp.]|nr:hypothetical protein [Pedosphaera sp.]
MKISSWFISSLLAGFALVLGLAIAAFYLNLGVPTESSRWCYEISEKKRHLATNTPSPKLLLVGGSSTLFGISAREIQSQTGCPTINLGTHAALGPTYILNQVKEVARPGDTVLLTLEYELYTYGKLDPGWADKLVVDYIIARDPVFFHGLSRAEQWNLFMLTPAQRLKRGLKNLRKPERRGENMGVYEASFLNEWGDQTHHLQAARPPKAAQIAQMRSLLGQGLPEVPKGFDAIASFCKWAQTNHIRVLATYPNICEQPEYHLPRAKQAAQTIRDFFTAHNVPVLGDYTEPMLPPDQFFDTMYHLTEEASLTRTRRLLVHLGPCLK